MAFIPVPTVATFALRFQLHGRPVVNTLSFQNGAGWDSGALSNMTGSLFAWWAASIAPHLSFNLQGVDCYALSLASDTAPSLTTPWPLDAQAGLVNGPAMPGNVAFAVSFRTGARGRSGRGRNFVAAVTENDVTGNELSLVRANGLRDGYADLIGVADAAGALWVVVQKYSNNAPLAFGVPRPVLTTTYADRIVDTMKGRLK